MPRERPLVDPISQRRAFALGTKREAAPPRVLAFALIEAFSMMSVAAAIEPLRAANRLIGREAYRWHLLSADGAPVAASNGIEVKVDGAVAEPGACEILFVCAGLRVDPQPQRRFSVALRRALGRGISIGAISAGSFVLARAGLLDGYRCTIHWEYRPAFIEKFPQLECTNALFEIDRNRYTSSGGLASMDLMLHLIAEEQGASLADAVANQFHLERIRTQVDPQRSGAIGRLTGTPVPVRRAIELMAEHIEEPLSTGAIARGVGLSARQLERLFARHVGETPARYYLALRLERARELLIHTVHPVLDVALATGFPSQSYFAQCYRARFGATPSAARRVVSG